MDAPDSLLIFATPFIFIRRSGCSWPISPGSVCSVGGLAGGPGPAPASFRGQRVSPHSREVVRGQSLGQAAGRLLWFVPLHLHWVHRCWPNQSSSLSVYGWKCWRMFSVCDECWPCWLVTPFQQCKGIFFDSVEAVAA